MNASLPTFTVVCGLSIYLQTIHAEKPNIILILVDDMGFSDIGSFGSEIPTPNIDKLAKNGLRFRNFYNSARSCPSRASLLTGLYPHQTGIGMMTTEAGNDFDFGVSGYRGYLNRNCVTIAEVLKSGGYHTYMTGKWHLGSDSLYKRPLQRGFEHFYGSYQGAFSYFDPKGTRCLIDEADTIVAPKGFYTTDAFTDKAIGFINGQKDNNPFFLYLAYNAPHWPLQAKTEDVNRFVGKYMKGWDEIRKERFQKQKTIGLLDKRMELSPRDSMVRAWNKLSNKEKVESDYRMAVYAAQIYAVDYNVGKLINYLEASGKLNNTLIIFLSDNGACAEPYKELGGGKQTDINNPEISGSVSYGVGWANASNTPFRSFKANVYEGGIATPFIAYWPAEMKSQKGKITNVYGYILNIMPTILDVAKVTYPAAYQGNKIQPLEGVSLLPALLTGKQDITGYQFWEHSYKRAVTHGKWKAISRIGTDKWELYDTEEDRTELHNLSEQYPEVVSDMATKWYEWAVRCKVLLKGTRTKNSYN